MKYMNLCSVLVILCKYYKWERRKTVRASSGVGLEVDDGVSTSDIMTGYESFENVAKFKYLGNTL